MDPIYILIGGAIFVGIFVFLGIRSHLKKRKESKELDALADSTVDPPSTDESFEPDEPDPLDPLLEDTFMSEQDDNPGETPEPIEGELITSSTDSGDGDGGNGGDSDECELTAQPWGEFLRQHVLAFVVTAILAVVVFSFGVVEEAIDFFTIVGIAALLSPLYADLLLNDPRRPNMPHAFTECQPNMTKAIMRRGTFVRAVMNNAGYRFMRLNAVCDYDGSVRWSRLMRIVHEASTVSQRAGIIPHRVDFGKFEFDVAYLLPHNWLKIYIYVTRGLIFVGIPIVQEVYQYKLPRNELKSNPDGSQHVVPTSDYTDHIFMLDFTWYLKIAAVETADSFPFDVLVAIQMRSDNPYLSLFGNEKWHEVLDSSMSGHVVEIMRIRPSEDFIGGVDYSGGKYEDLFAKLDSIHQQSAINALNRELRSVVEQIAGTGSGTTDDSEEDSETDQPATEQGSEAGFGLHERYGLILGSVQIISVDPSDPELAKKIRRPAEARLEARAEVFAGLAKGRAYEAIMKPLMEAETLGQAVAMYESQIQTAAQAKGGTFLVNTGSKGSGSGDSGLSDDLLTIIAKQLKDIADRGGNLDDVKRGLGLTDSDGKSEGEAA